jgi:hypothetical protein
MITIEAPMPYSLAIPDFQALLSLNGFFFLPPTAGLFLFFAIVLAGSGGSPPAGFMRW